MGSTSSQSWNYDYLALQEELEKENLKAGIAAAKTSRLETLGRAMAMSQNQPDSGAASGGGGSAGGSAGGEGQGDRQLMTEEDRLSTEFEQNRTLLRDRGEQDKNEIELKAKLDADRRERSLSTALGTLQRFR